MRATAVDMNRPASWRQQVRSMTPISLPLTGCQIGAPAQAKSASGST